MEWLLQIIALLLMLITLLLLCRVRVKIYYSLQEKRFSISLFGIPIRKTRKKLSKQTQRKSKHSPRGFIREIFRHAKIKKLEIDIKLGTGDAMADVFIVQLLRSVLYSFCVLRLNAEKTILRIEPSFNREVLEARIEFIFSVGVLEIIQIYIRRTILSRKAHMKEGKRHDKTYSGNYGNNSAKNT